MHVTGTERKGPVSVTAHRTPHPQDFPTSPFQIWATLPAVERSGKALTEELQQFFGRSKFYFLARIDLFRPAFKSIVVRLSFR